MIIGIMGAMNEEISSILSHMKNRKTVEFGGRKYHLGEIGEHKVVLVFSRWGKVAAAATATSLIIRFNIEQLIFTGVAGATTPKLNIGDIVISSELFQHDMDARPLMPRFQIPLTAITFFKADPELIAKARNATDGLFSSLSTKVSPESIKKFKISRPKCIVGTIATGDQFIYSRQSTDAIIKEQPKTLAVEMEGAAVAQVCTDHNVPFVVIRTISDNADHTAEVDFPKFVDEIAKHYSEHIIDGMLKASISPSPIRSML